MLMRAVPIFNGRFGTLDESRSGHTSDSETFGAFFDRVLPRALKTTARLLSNHANAEDAWFDNMRQLRSLVSQLEAISLKVVEDDPRSARRPGGRRPLTTSEG